MCLSAPKVRTCLAGLLLAVHGLLAGHALVQHNVTIDETGHLLSGLLTWCARDVSYHKVNPPLVKLVQSLPLLPAHLELPGPEARGPSEDSAFKVFLAQNRERYLLLVPRARFINVLLSLGIGLLLYHWGKAVFGDRAGLVALGLWVFSPNALAWAGVCTADLGATFFALAALAALRAYVGQPRGPKAFLAGLLLGLAQLAKFSLLVLYPVTVLLWLAAWWHQRSREDSLRPRWHHLLTLLGISLLVLNAGYGFQGFDRPLGQFLFGSQALSGMPVRGGPGNRFHGTWLGSLPVPLPAAYLLGLDEQKARAEHRGRPNYLCGEWREGGWWYYYFVAAAVKVPLGTWLLALLALVGAGTLRRCRDSLLQEGLIGLPPLALLALFSWQGGINSHFRYVLPAFPFLFLAISRVGKLLDNAGQTAPQAPSAGPALVFPFLAVGLAAVALGWNVVAVARIHPHYLSYFNEMAGGPEQGWRWLAESNLDWGQDLFFLKDWLSHHPDRAQSLHLIYYGGITPEMVDVHCPPISWEEGPQPGWFAVSANAVVGMSFEATDGRGRPFYCPPYAYCFFQQLAPTARAGYSILIYHVSPDEAHAVRQRLGLPLLYRVPRAGEGTNP